MNTRASICISSDDEDCPGTSPSGERRNWKPGTSGPDGGGLAGSDATPGTSGPETGPPGSSSTRGISGPEEVCLARHDGTSSLDEDNYSSYLTLVARE